MHGGLFKRLIALNIRAHLRTILLTIACYLTLQCEARCKCENGSQVITLGPEGYWAKRMRQGGTKQSGWLTGANLSYQRLKRCCFYLALDGYWAQGILRGKSGGGMPLKSQLTDRQVEGRLGYTWQMKRGIQLSATPFVGYGYFWESNKFSEPTPHSLHYLDSYRYYTLGLVSGARFSPRFDCYASVQAKFMVNGSSYVSNDADEDGSIPPSTLQMEDEVQWRGDIAFNYCLLRHSKKLWLSLAPFYEYRHYGGHMGYPYDFIETEYQIWGGELALQLRF